MVSPIYWITALTYATVFIIIYWHDKNNNPEPNEIEKAYRTLMNWVIFFCLQDAVWGICAGNLVNSKTALFLSSTVFHASTVITTFYWLSYVLTYLGDRIKYRRVYLVLDGLVVVIQLVLLVANFFRPTIFYISASGEYCTAAFRPIAFLNQYLVYLVMGVCATMLAIVEKEEMRKKCIVVLVFSLAPIFSGIFQFLYPDGPFYSMGYFLGCFMIHIFIVSGERDALLQLQNEKRIAAQVKIANTDELTGLQNRRAYEQDLRELKHGEIDEDFVYVSIDVNGLKVVNDTLGHRGGDELLKGAAECMKQCLKPYGKVYRIGGDEFAALIYASINQLEGIKKDLDETVLKWQGELVDELSLACGYVCRFECLDVPVMEMARIADERMYSVKSAYYESKGIDRRGQQSAYVALCDSCNKILKINLTQDTYRIIRMDTSEKTKSQGFSDTISAWLCNFGNSGMVHEEDKESFLEKTNIDFMRSYFASGKRCINIVYKRNIGNEYRQVVMEVMRAEDYENDNQNLYLYVKDIDQ